MRHGCSLLLFGLMGYCYPAVTTGLEISVQPDATGMPVLAAAMKAADPGDVILLRAGVYRESIIITKPISLVGEAGAVLDPSQPLSPRWEPAEAIGQGGLPGDRGASAARALPGWQDRGRDR